MLRISPGKARKRAARTGSPRAAGASAAGRRLRRGMLRGLAAVAVALGLLGSGVAGASGAGAGAAAAAGRGGHCTRTVTGTHHGALVAGSGVLCLDRATQFGPVHVWPRAGLKVTASVISGAVTATRARSVRICGSTIIGPLRADATAGPVTAGGGASCRGDTGHGRLVISGSAGRVRVAGLRQQGPVTLSGNVAGVRLSGGSVGGGVTVRGNRGRASVVISANAIAGSLACAANRPAPADRHRPNTVSGTASGQCAGLVPPRPRRQALPPLAQDLSGALPNLNYNQAVGDFTGVGHDELAYYQPDSETAGHLDIANVAKYGGGVVQSVPSDLVTLPPLGPIPCNADLSVCDRLGEPKIAATASNIYLLAVTAINNGSAFAVRLYKMPHDGSCAEPSCALESVDLANLNQLIFPTSLAVGVVSGRTLIAVGLAGVGIEIFDANLQKVTTLTDSAVSNLSNPPVALSFGPPSGPGQGGWLGAALLAGPWGAGAGWVLNPDGREKSSWLNNWGTAQDWGVTFARLGGQMAAVFTRNDGDVIAVNADTGTIITDLPSAQRTGTPTGVTAVTPVDGDSSNQDLVVGMKDGTGDKVLRDVDGQLTGVPFVPGGDVTGTADQVYSWYPGYGAARVRVANSSAGPVDVAMASRPDPGFGCWLDASVTQPPVPAFPVSDAPVAAGATSPDYFAGALTAGPDGSCASAQPGGKGERAAYVIITPAGDSADEHIVKLAVGADGTLRVDSQVGGYLTASLSQVSSTPGSWGTWRLAVTGGGAPAAAAAPGVQGFRLTAAPDPANYQPPAGPAADDPCRPVYRFDVTGAQWKNVISAGQVTAQVPAMTAQASTDGGHNWQDLGQLMPSAAPAVAADGTVTLGPASFFFQNPAGTATAPGVVPAGQASQCPAAGQDPVTEVRVVSGGLASSPVTLADPKAPPLNGGTGATPIAGIQATPDGNGGAAALPRADGVDQAGLTLQLTSSGGSVNPSDPRYNLAYYRDDATKALVTGLYQPGDYAGYTAAGRYAADGTAGQPARNYLVTTSTAPQRLDPVMNDTGTVTNAYTGSPFAVAASSNPLTPAGASITGGIGITGCTASPTAACTLAVPAGTAPALYQADGPASGPATGLLLSATAITGRASLPLQTGTANAHQLGSAPLTVTASQAKLTSTSQFFPSDTVDTALVTAGQLVPVLSVQVGSGG